jgi:hypothetical protein
MAKRTFRVVRKNRKSRRRIKGGSPESDNLKVLLANMKISKMFSSSKEYRSMLLSCLGKTINMFISKINLNSKQKKQTGKLDEIRYMIHNRIKKRACKTVNGLNDTDSCEKETKELNTIGEKFDTTKRVSLRHKSLRYMSSLPSFTVLQNILNSLNDDNIKTDTNVLKLYFTNKEYTYSIKVVEYTAEETAFLAKLKENSKEAVNEFIKKIESEKKKSSPLMNNLEEPVQPIKIVDNTELYKKFLSVINVKPEETINIDEFNEIMAPIKKIGGLEIKTYNSKNGADLNYYNIEIYCGLFGFFLLWVPSFFSALPLTLIHLLIFFLMRIIYYLYLVSNIRDKDEINSSLKQFGENFPTVIWVGF